MARGTGTKLEGEHPHTRVPTQEGVLRDPHSRLWQSPGGPHTACLPLLYPNGRAAVLGDSITDPNLLILTIPTRLQW